MKKQKPWYTILSVALVTLFLGGCVSSVPKKDTSPPSITIVSATITDYSVGKMSIVLNNSGGEGYYTWHADYVWSHPSSDAVMQQGSESAWIDEHATATLSIPSFKINGVEMPAPKGANGHADFWLKVINTGKSSSINRIQFIVP